MRSTLHKLWSLTVLFLTRKAANSALDICKIFSPYSRSVSSKILKSQPPSNWLVHRLAVKLQNALPCHSWGQKKLKVNRASRHASSSHDSSNRAPVIWRIANWRHRLHTLRSSYRTLAAGTVHCIGRPCTLHGYAATHIEACLYVRG